MTLDEVKSLADEYLSCFIENGILKHNGDENGNYIWFTRDAGLAYSAKDGGVMIKEASQRGFWPWMRAEEPRKIKDLFALFSVIAAEEGSLKELEKYNKKVMDLAGAFIPIAEEERGDFNGEETANIELKHHGGSYGTTEITVSSTKERVWCAYRPEDRFLDLAKNDFKEYVEHLERTHGATKEDFDYHFKLHSWIVVERRKRDCNKTEQPKKKEP